MSYLNRECDGDDNDNDDDDDDNDDGDDDDDDGDDDDDDYLSKKFSNTFCIYSVKVRNLTSNKLFWSHLTYTVMAKIVSTLIWWICQNTLRFLTLTPDLLDIAMVKSYVSSMKQIYISYWQNTPQHSQKLEFYRSFKSNHTTFVL